MLALNSLNLIFSLLLALSISSSSLAQLSPEQPTNIQPSSEQSEPTNSQTDITNQSTNNELQPNTVIIQTPNNQPFIIKNQSDSNSWLIPSLTTFLATLLGGFISFLLTNKRLKEQRESVNHQLSTQRELSNTQLEAQRKLAQEQIKSQDKLTEEQNQIQERVRDIEKYRQSLVNTAEMMKEWDSLSMRKARSDSWDNYVEDDQGNKIPEQDMIPFSQIKITDRIHITRVLEFFDRLSFMRDKGMVDEKAAKEYFQKDYMYWEKFYAAKQRKKDENTADNSIISKDKERHEWLIVDTIYKEIK